MTLRAWTCILLAATLAGASGARPAQAQGPVTEPAAVVDLLTDAGYRDVRVLELAGAIWKAEAVTREGLRVQLLVNSRNGTISRQAIRAVDRGEPEERED
jgi:hypothetical protein